MSSRSTAVARAEAHRLLLLDELGLALVEEDEGCERLFFDAGELKAFTAAPASE